MSTPALSRRSFIAAAGAAATVVAARPAAAAAAPFDLGVQLYSLRGYPVEVALGHARDLGLRFVEFYPGMFPVNSTPDRIARLRATLADLGLAISAHGVNGFSGDAAANRRVFEFARAAGIRTLSADPAPEAFASLEELVKEFDVRVAIHNHGPKHRYDKVVDVLRAIENRDERIGACADLGHFIRSGERPVEVIRLLRGRLYGIHLKDFAEMQDRTRGVILGRGHLDVPAVMEALVSAAFPADGALSIEYEEQPQNPLADLRACVEVARAAIAAL